MKKGFFSRVTAVVLVLALVALSIGCVPPQSTDRFDPKRQARQDDLLRWMQDDHRN